MNVLDLQGLKQGTIINLPLEYFGVDPSTGFIVCKVGKAGVHFFTIQMLANATIQKNEESDKNNKT